MALEDDFPVWTVNQEPFKMLISQITRTRPSSQLHAAEFGPTKGGGFLQMPRLGFLVRDQPDDYHSSLGEHVVRKEIPSQSLCARLG